ncbi:hypothetical protein PS1_001423 [Malus domestica]
MNCVFGDYATIHAINELYNSTANADVSNGSPRKASLADWGNMDHPGSYGTHYRNGTLTLAVNGLSLEKSWYDPRKVPPWAFKNADGLLHSPLAYNSNSKGKSGPSGFLRIIELENGESLPGPPLSP